MGLGLKSLGLQANRSRARDINEAGQVVGDTFSSPGDFYHAFVYTNGQIMDLNALIDPALQVTLTQGTAINDKGQILANGSSPLGIGAYLLTPTATAVPEPSTLAL